ncbi:Glutathionyl-hydroquinone reductase [Lachnellula suecica]|uniref:Glutathionyl-hydroquinone reductase n=1 Tax=Lachnellula suecica TaxID=602035 RepID=A0A8T9C434_9HELO|nr:Glutathionyl-hydroquinone reductase [Lachnellula suecica]
MSEVKHSSVHQVPPSGVPLVPQLPTSFAPPTPRFSSAISPDPGSEFLAEPDRYALYIHLGCPWAHRANIVYNLKRLQPLLALSVVSIHRDQSKSWTYDGSSGSDATDQVEGVKNMKELYQKADPAYTGYFSIPLIWDRKKKTIVNSDSGEIIEMLYSSFDAFLSPELREVNKPGGGLYPEVLRSQIDILSNEIHLDFNWGTYKCGFAPSPADYDASMKRLFGRLDEIEKLLGHSKFLLGNHITQPDIM